MEVDAKETMADSKIRKSGGVSQSMSKISSLNPSAGLAPAHLSVTIDDNIGYV